MQNTVKPLRISYENHKEMLKIQGQNQVNLQVWMMLLQN